MHTQWFLVGGIKKPVHISYIENIHTYARLFMYIHTYARLFMYIHTYARLSMYIHTYARLFMFVFIHFTISHAYILKINRKNSGKDSDPEQIQIQTRFRSRKDSDPESVLNLK